MVQLTEKGLRLRGWVKLKRIIRHILIKAGASIPILTLSVCYLEIMTV